MAGFSNGYGKYFLDSVPEARYYYITAFEQERLMFLKRYIHNYKQGLVVL